MQSFEGEQGAIDRSIGTKIQIYKTFHSYESRVGAKPVLSKCSTYATSFDSLLTNNLAILDERYTNFSCVGHTIRDPSSSRRAIFDQ